MVSKQVSTEETSILGGLQGLAKSSQNQSNTGQVFSGDVTGAHASNVAEAFSFVCFQKCRRSVPPLRWLNYRVGMSPGEQALHRIHSSFILPIRQPLLTFTLLTGELGTAQHNQ